MKQYTFYPNQYQQILAKILLTILDYCTIALTTPFRALKQRSLGILQRSDIYELKNKSLAMLQRALWRKPCTTFA